MQENAIMVERSILAELPIQITIGNVAKLTVNINTTSSMSSLYRSSSVMQGVAHIRLKVPQDKQEARLLVYLNQEEPIFDLDNKEYFKELVVPLNQEDFKSVVFDLKPRKEGHALIKLQFFKEIEGTYIGELTLNSIVLDPAKSPAYGPNYLEQYELVTTGTFFDDVSAAHPDITLLILQSGTSEYQAYLTSKDRGVCPVGNIPIKADTQSKFRALFKDIEKTDLSPDTIDEKIKAIGHDLYAEIVPRELKEVYWDIRERIQSIQIWTMEPWIPWPIIKPWRRRKNGILEEDEYLCERYATSRWLIGIAPVLKDRLRKIRIVVPSDTNLKSALEERDWIKEFARANGMYASIASSFQEVMSTLRTGNYDVLHFSTHGKHHEDLPILSKIELENGEPLEPAHISGMATTFGQDHPLVVLNACQSGIQDFSFTEINGWARHFLEAGASAFICTLWSVSDETALRFTQELYNQLLQGIPLGEAIRATRLRCKKIGDPSWLAYELYGHPNMKVKIGST